MSAPKKKRKKKGGVRHGRRGARTSRKPTKRKRKAARWGASCRSVVVTPRVTRMQGTFHVADNRRVRQAINDVSFGAGRVPSDRASRAMQYLSSLDMTRMSPGRRGGLTRSNFTSAIRQMADWEMRTGKKLKKTGGISRASMEKLKSGIKKFRRKYLGAKK